MFTGIIEETGQVVDFSKTTLSVKAKLVLAETKIGDSIAVNGVCLTVKEIKDKRHLGMSLVNFNVLPETLRDTNLGKASLVNLERAATLQTRLGGHLVSGHVDTVGTVQETGKNLKIKYDAKYSKFVIDKGSVAVNGISLTIQKKTDNSLTIGIIPHTLDNTNLKNIKINDKVNLEFDMIGKYVLNAKKTNKIKNIYLG